MLFIQQKRNLSGSFFTPFQQSVPRAPALWYGKQHTALHRAATNTQHGPEPAKFINLGHFFSSFPQQEGNLEHLSPLHLSCRQVSLMMQETDVKARVICALPSTSASTLSQRKEKTETIAFQLLISSVPFAAATDTVLMQGFTFIIWKAAREVKTMQMWPIKAIQEVLLQHSWMAFLNSRATPWWEQTVSSWSLSLNPDFLIYPCATQAITASSSGLHLTLWINPTFSLQEYCRFHLHSDVLKESSGKWKQPEKATPSLSIIVQD